MNKKALSAIIAVSLLIALAVVLAGIVYISSKRVLLNLSPPADELCREINFDSEIYKENAHYYLAIVNKGNAEIEGISIKEVSGGVIRDKENVEMTVLPGYTEIKELNSVTVQDEDKDFLTVPEIALGESPTKELQICPNEFGETIRINV